MLLSKHHGLGNDFLVVLDERNAALPAIGSGTAVALCDRRRGIGADGLIHGARPAPDDDSVDVVMHLFNSDGSRAEMSGNGIRCLAQAVLLGAAGQARPLRIGTDAGTRRAELVEVVSPVEHRISVEMGEVGEGPHIPEPVAESLAGRFATVDVGNPHLVVLVDDPSLVDLETEGAWLEQQFPGGVNVEFVAPDDSDGRGLVLRVWERGAGVTEACGTGACAAAAQARRWGLVGDRVVVHMPGGEAAVCLDGDRAVLTGPAIHVADLQVAG